MPYSEFKGFGRFRDIQCSANFNSAVMLTLIKVSRILNISKATEDVMSKGCDMIGGRFLGSYHTKIV